MDNSLVVAATSIATIALTSLFNILSKSIDSIHKINEHKLTIRSAYVTTKIEAAKSFIVNNNTEIHSADFFIRFLQNYKAGGTPDENLLAFVIQFEEKSLANTLLSNDVSDLYFDITDSAKEVFLIIPQIAQHQRDLNEKFNNGTITKEKFVNHIDSLIELVNQVRNIRLKMNDFVRNELGKYDII